MSRSDEILIKEIKKAKIIEKGCRCTELGCGQDYCGQERLKCECDNE